MIHILSTAAVVQNLYVKRTTEFRQKSFTEIAFDLYGLDYYYRRIENVQFSSVTFHR